MFDKRDVRLIAKVVVIVGGGSTLLLTVSAAFGLAVRVFGLMAG